MVKLRDYQQLAVQHILRRIKDGCSRLYATLPTGTGKGVILASLAVQRRCVGRILVLIHRQDIALQLVKVLRQAELEVGLLMQGYRELSAPVVVATTQSVTPTMLRSLIEANEEPLSTILIDEAHHAIAGSAYERIISDIEAATSPLPVITIGYTATPYRSDKQSMLSLLPTCAFARDIPDMVRDGWLAPLRWEQVRVNIDLDEVVTTRQGGELDYAEEDLARELVRSAITNAIAQQVAPKIGQRPTLVFGVKVEHAEQLAEAFRHKGLKAQAISGACSRAEREQLFADWRAGKIQVVCNCSLLTEGFDYPEIAALVIARPTLSPGLYVQMLGRGTRPAKGKQDCLVLDVMGNHPDTSRQVVLPHIIGISKEEGGKEVERREMTDPILKALLGAKTETGLSLLDPIGQSPYRWTAYRHGYFAMVGRHEAAIIERDPKGSGLYRTRLYTMQREQQPEHRWIEQSYLPLRQQVALVHDFTSAISVKALSSKEASWLAEPASEKQLEALQRLHPGLARQARAKGWTKRIASDAITFCLLRRTLLHPPTT